MISQLFAAILAGIAAHQTKHIIDNLNTTSQTVKNLASYSVGYIVIGLVFEGALIGTELTHAQKVIVSAVFWLAGVGVGVGVFLGYVLESMRGK